MSSMRGVTECEEEVPTIRLPGATRRAALPSVEKLVAVRRRSTIDVLDDTDIDELTESCSRVRVSPVPTFPKRASVLAPPPLPRPSVPSAAPPPARPSRPSELASTPVSPVRPVSVPDQPVVVAEAVAGELDLDIDVDVSDFRTPVGKALSVLGTGRGALLVGLFLACALAMLAFEVMRLV